MIIIVGVTPSTVDHVRTYVFYHCTCPAFDPATDPVQLEDGQLKVKVERRILAGTTIQTRVANMRGLLGQTDKTHHRMHPKTLKAFETTYQATNLETLACNKQLEKMKA